MNEDEIATFRSLQRATDPNEEDPFRELEKIKAEIYTLMGWEKVKVNKKDKWVGEAEVGLIAGEERVKIDLRERTDFDGDVLFNGYREVYDLVAKKSEYPVLTAK